MAHQDRAVSALEGVLHTALRARSAEGPNRDLIVTLDNKDLRVRWLTVGWPQQVEAALHDKPRPDVIAAPRMSPGARAVAMKAGIGWVDESGAADIVIRDSSGTTIIIDTKGKPRCPWTRASGGGQPRSPFARPSSRDRQARPRTRL